ncbi:hypothetical protein [Fusobacterium polymorphum]|uniref:Uncharacterized protein n=1 Tax=Fusobacterium nucleatum subsp. polymorphum TaxID=76857 RepID=A0A2C6BJ69_FUSNP|nr:hypothetical protein [Fusobacterium polymorphum]PHI06556.1 hypothetical protein CBG54_05695 [Fusobacterium polymorphum]
MSSVTKNPQILISASFVYNWFLNLGPENEKFLENNEFLNHIKTDENIVQSLKNDFLSNEDEKNIDKRFEEIVKKIIGEKNG